MLSSGPLHLDPPRPAKWVGAEPGERPSSRGRGRMYEDPGNRRAAVAVFVVLRPAQPHWPMAAHSEEELPGGPGWAEPLGVTEPTYKCLCSCLLK